ncbi:hypothetical protein Agub_g13274 [Astrephomene gubernaculifera]|uniref:DUF3253 domain-containing protein n=1 Tax=Astrephomene gubernaculifera TaxID=47775 RepID=A0AAD3DZM9_9CHLO|nr:hypothetical protein Agub_g13274 [Astrephomene gubernaculifera]
MKRKRIQKLHSEGPDAKTARTCPSTNVPEDAARAVEDEEHGGEQLLRQELRSTILAIVSERFQRGTTACPSEAPRRLRLPNWRELMELTRDIARELASEGRIEILQRGQVIDHSSSIRGPIRIRMKQ